MIYSSSLFIHVLTSRYVLKMMAAALCSLWTMGWWRFYLNSGAPSPLQPFERQAVDEDEPIKDSFYNQLDFYLNLTKQQSSSSA